MTSHMPLLVQAMMPLAAAILSAYLTGHVLKRRENELEKKRLTISLLDKYMSPEFNIARHVVGDIQLKWNQGDKTSIKKFLIPIDRESFECEPLICRNSLTEHENLSWVLNFFGSLEFYRAGELLDNKIFSQLFGSIYEGYRAFFRQFCLEYNSQMTERQVQPVLPAWYRGLEGLDRHFYPPTV